ncbi:MAG: hypothetical protein ACMZ64_01375 [Oleiphilus sp.]
MFEKLISLKLPLSKQGIICSLEDGQYTALQVDQHGKTLAKTEKRFNTATSAKSWLNKHGIFTIMMRQAPV